MAYNNVRNLHSYFLFYDMLVHFSTEVSTPNSPIYWTIYSTREHFYSTLLQLIFFKYFIYCQVILI